MTDELRFEWDLKKAWVNDRKHGVSFTLAKQFLESDAASLEIFDEAHSADEDRFITIGPIDGGVILVVWTEPEEGVVRIISARWATKGEEQIYRTWRQPDE